MSAIKKAGFVVKPHASSVEKVLRDTIGYLEGRGVECVLEEAAARVLGIDDGLARDKVPAASDLVIVLGGDGTLLSIAHLAAEARVPVMGINMGRLGFLTEVPVTEIGPSLDAFLSGDPRVISTRWLLEVRAPKLVSNCLNDTVITKGTLSRMIEFSIAVDGKEVATLKADGMIVSTPTGSTAYSLSAGGPIINPGVDGIVITPICPHTLSFRPMIMPSSSTVSLRLMTGGEEVYLTLDGQRGGGLFHNDVVEVRRSRLELKLVSSPFRNFYDLLKEKLNWAG